MNRRKVDVVVGFILMALAMTLLVRDDLVIGGVETDLGSMFLPRILALFIIAFSFTIAAQAILKLRSNKKLEEHEVVDTNGYLGIAIYISIFATYWVLVQKLGFIITTPFVMIAIMLLLGGRNWKIMIPLSTVAPVVIYYACYNVLRVMLPVWSL